MAESVRIGSTVAILVCVKMLTLMSCICFFKVLKVAQSTDRGLVQAAPSDEELGSMPPAGQIALLKERCDGLEKELTCKQEVSACGFGAWPAVEQRMHVLLHSCVANAF